MSEWKAGGQAMVDIVEINGPSALIRRHGTKDHRTDVVRSDVFRPLPTDPHQALKDAVIAAAGEVRTTAPVTDGRLRAIIKMFYAIDALTAAQNPPKLDPVEVFYQVTDGQSTCGPYGWKHCKDTRDVCYCRNNIASGLAAVEAARGAK